MACFLIDLYLLFVRFRLQSYVVKVENVRNNDRTAGMNEDHRWLHLDIVATYFTYTPEVGQRLTGWILEKSIKFILEMEFW